MRERIGSEEDGIDSRESEGDRGGDRHTGHDKGEKERAAGWRQRG